MKWTEIVGKRVQTNEDLFIFNKQPDVYEFYTKDQLNDFVQLNLEKGTIFKVSDPVKDTVTLTSFIDGEPDREILEQGEVNLNLYTLI